MRIGIDLGGTKTEIIALGADGTTLLRRRVATPTVNYEGVLNTIADLVFSAEKELGQNGSVGIATPGAVSNRSGLMKNSNNTMLNGRQFESDISQKLARATRIENDANCFTLSEAVDGAGLDARVVFGVIIGTGVGGGIVIEKRVVGGRNKIAGEWGHNPLPWAEDNEIPGVKCYCGKSGCIETFLSGAGLSREYEVVTGKKLTGEEIGLAAAAGDARAQVSLTKYQSRLARSLAAIINILDPDVIVLGGGLSNILQLYNGLHELISTYVFSDGIDTSVVRSVHGDSSGVRGAAWLWPVDSSA